MEAVKKLNQLIAGFSNAPRIGESVDDPEGARYIQISDTLTNDIIDALQQIKISIINSQEKLKKANNERLSFAMHTLSDKIYMMDNNSPGEIKTVSSLRGW